jgi:hypothetical protein
MATKEEAAATAEEIAARIKEASGWVDSGDELAATLSDRVIVALAAERDSLAALAERLRRHLGWWVDMFGAAGRGAHRAALESQALLDGRSDPAPADALRDEMIAMLEESVIPDQCFAGSRMARAGDLLIRLKLEKGR